MADKKQSDDSKLDAAILNSIPTADKLYPDTFQCSNGVVLKVKPVSSSLVVAAQRRHPRPTVPKWYNEDRQREEENPLHPDYIAAVRQWDIHQGTIAIHASLLLGTEIKVIPDGFPRPEDETWAELVKETGVDVADGKNARYVDWLRYYVLAANEDLQGVMAAIENVGTRIPEDEVDAAAESFRNN